VNHLLKPKSFLAFLKISLIPIQKMQDGIHSLYSLNHIQHILGKVVFLYSKCLLLALLLYLGQELSICADIDRDKRFHP